MGCGADGAGNAVLRHRRGSCCRRAPRRRARVDVSQRGVEEQPFRQGVGADGLDLVQISARSDRSSRSRSCHDRVRHSICDTYWPNTSGPADSALTSLEQGACATFGQGRGEQHGGCDVRFLGHLVGGRTAVTLFGVVASLMFLPSVAGAYPGEGLSGPGFRIHRGSGSESDVNVCSFAVSPGAAHCDLRVRIDAGARSRLPARAGAVKPDVLGDEGAYDPSYLQSAYDVAAATAADGGGAGQTVAIIDSYNDPNVTSDLAHYRSYFGLPACPAGVVSHTATGCVFEKVNQTGGTDLLPFRQLGLGDRDLARRRDGQRDLQQVPDPPGRGKQQLRSKTSAPP